MEFGTLNNAVNNAFGEMVTVLKGTAQHPIKGVFNLPTDQKSVGGIEVEVPDPFFEFNIAEFAKTGAVISDSIVRSGITYTIISKRAEFNDLIRVVVRQY